MTKQYRPSFRLHQRAIDLIRKAQRDYASPDSTIVTRWCKRLMEDELVRILHSDADQGE